MHITFIDFIKYFIKYLFLFLILFAICLPIAGAFSYYGIPNLFREDAVLQNSGFWAYRNSPVIWSLASVTLYVATIWIFVYLTENDKPVLTDPEFKSVNWNTFIYYFKKNAKFISPLVSISLIVPLLAFIYPIFNTAFIPTKYEVFRAFVGILIGIIFIIVFITLIYLFYHLFARIFIFLKNQFRLPNWVFGHEKQLAFLFALGMPLLVAITYHRIVPAVAIFTLIGLVALTYYIFTVLPYYLDLPFFIFLLCWIILANGRPYKYTFPNIKKSDNQSYYDKGERVDLHNFDKNFDEFEIREKKKEFLINPIESLANWRAQYGKKPPKLVVLCTTGGAYRAAFWTAIVLDNLEELSKPGGKLDGLTNNVRLITGASGGMVGAAYFAVKRDDMLNGNNIENMSLQKQGCDQVKREYKQKGKSNKSMSVVQRLESDTERSRKSGVFPTQFPIPRNSLDPVAQQLVQRDILHIFTPWPQSMDRGRVLESQWLALGNKTFADLRESERSGCTPSLILSPMLVETGQPLLISNLDLSEIRGSSREETREFFELFPKSEKSFRLNTAVRMNAAFPYVSPAVSLPTEPTMRVVDAGYYDNYGVNLAVAFLSEDNIKNWISTNTSGIVIIQIRLGSPITEEHDYKSENKFQLGRSLQGFTSPIEGGWNARESSMIFRNDQELRQLEKLYPEGFIHSVIFKDVAAASVSWYLPKKELNDMIHHWESKENSHKLDLLAEFWNKQG